MAEGRSRFEWRQTAAIRATIALSGKVELFDIWPPEEEAASEVTLISPVELALLMGCKDARSR